MRVLMVTTGRVYCPHLGNGRSSYHSAVVAAGEARCAGRNLLTSWFYKEHSAANCLNKDRRVCVCLCVCVCDGGPCAACGCHSALKPQGRNKPTRLADKKRPLSPPTAFYLCLKGEQWPVGALATSCLHAHDFVPSSCYP